MELIIAYNQSAPIISSSSNDTKSLSKESMGKKQEALLLGCKGIFSSAEVVVTSLSITKTTKANTIITESNVILRFRGKTIEKKKRGIDNSTCTAFESQLSESCKDTSLKNCDPSKVKSFVDSYTNKTVSAGLIIFLLTLSINQIAQRNRINRNRFFFRCSACYSK
jgi:hypothetical protein